LSNPIVYIVLRLALAIEATGICAGAWFLGMIHKKIAGFQLDEVYVGTPEERAAGLKPDSSVHPGREYTIGTTLTAPVGASGNAPANWEEALAKLGPVAETFSQRRERILKNIKNMKDLVESATSDDEKSAYEAGVKMEVKALEKLNKEETELDAPVKDIESA
jgi:hypothetical protein